FLALFGGLEVFGVAGVLVGPVVVSVAVVTLRLYVETAIGRSIDSRWAAARESPLGPSTVAPVTPPRFLDRNHWNEGIAQPGGPAADARPLIRRSHDLAITEC